MIKNISSTDNQIAFNTAEKANYQHAVVIGGSMAGLTAARVLSDHFAHVTVIERDEMPDGQEFRKGVPQGRHAHILLQRGQLILEKLFPGLSAELLAAGAETINVGTDLAFCSPNGWLPAFDSDMEIIGASRRLLDYVVYGRLAQFSNITFRPLSDVMSLCVDGSGRHVVGLEVSSRENGRIEKLPANLVVDASGRSSKAPEWLHQLGYQPPAELTVNAFAGYATRLYRQPDTGSRAWKSVYIMPIPPDMPRGGVILPMENGGWQVTLIGIGRDYPPTDEAGFLEFARSLKSPQIYEAIKDAKPLTAPYGYRRAENRLRQFDQLSAYLEGFLAMGDAVYALNPVYGQGMTLASIASQLLHDCLVAHELKGETADFTGLASRFQKQLGKELIMPWQQATNEDMRWPETQGKQDLGMAMRMVNGYFGQVMQAMPHSAKVTDAFYRVQHMVAPPTTLMRPDMLLTVLKTNLATRFSKS
ncbi:MAG: FAD-dependent monooxygenase [Ardenticatenaceae bacterium]|nr:FAD-dependent monooxygenase [Ardenticatenaceae bacterium]